MAFAKTFKALSDPDYIKNDLKFLLFVLCSGLIGGYCIALYLPDMYSQEMLQQMQAQGMTTEMLALTIITIIAALCLFPGDKLIFGPFNSWVNDQYNISPELPKIISGLLVGGVIEEVMMRLFFMSLLVLIISKLFYRHEKDIPVRVFAVANIISALLFAAGHLPGTAAMTTLTPIVLFRCFLFNGGLGLCFGYLYRKYGIGYAMIAHGFAHLISDLLMIIFL